MTWLLIRIITFIFLALFESVYGMYLLSIGQTGLLLNLTSVSADHLSGTFVNKNHVVAFLSMSFIIILAARLYFMNMWSYNAHTKRVKILRFVTHPARLFDLTLLMARLTH